MRCTASQPIGLLGLLFLLWAGCRGAQPDAPPESVDAFVGDSVCASCHGDIAALYRRTPKAQALYRLAPDRVVEDLSGQEAVYEPRTGFYYRAFRQGDAFFQEEYRLDARGRKTHRLVYPMQYVVGSGNAARTYLYEENGYLFQLPLSWYAQSGRWGLSPGYERTNARFFRPIRQACLGCHTGHFRPVPETSNRYEAFSLGIGCERCHGPGARHVALHRGGKRSRSGPDTTILNPRRIPRSGAWTSANNAIWRRPYPSIGRAKGRWTTDRVGGFRITGSPSSTLPFRRARCRSQAMWSACSRAPVSEAAEGGWIA